MKYKFIGTEKDLLDLGFETYFNHKNEVSCYVFSINQHRKNNNVTIELWINNNTKYISLNVSTINNVKEDSIVGYEEDMLGGFHKVDCYTKRQYSKYVFEEEIFLDVLCKMCKKGLIEEVNDD